MKSIHLLDMNKIFSTILIFRFQRIRLTLSEKNGVHDTSQKSTFYSKSHETSVKKSIAIHFDLRYPINKQ